MRIGVKLIPVLFAMLAITAADPCAGDEIFRWVDEDGVIHFGEKADVPPDAELVDLGPGGTSSLGPPAPVETTESPQPDKTESSRAQQQRDERAERRKLAMEEEQQVAAACQHARDRVAKLEPSPRVLMKVEDGTISRMDDNQRLELLAEAKTFIAENCDK